MDFKELNSLQNGALFGVIIGLIFGRFGMLIFWIIIIAIWG